MQVRIIIKSFVDTRTEEERSIPFYVKGRPEFSEVWRGDLDINDQDTYLTMISIIADGVAHPICDIPFAIGVGHWLWVPPDPIGEGEDTESGMVLEEPPPRFINLGKAAFPAMKIVGKNRRFWKGKNHA